MEANSSFENHSIALAFFSICEQQKDILQLLYSQKLLHLLLNDLNTIFRKYQYKFASPEELNNKNRLFILAYHIGGFWNLLIMWLEDGCQKSVAELSEMVARLSANQQI